MAALKINGYTVIASIPRWEEWTVELDEQGNVSVLHPTGQQDGVEGNKIDSWTYVGINTETGEEIYPDYKVFNTLGQLEEHLKNLPAGKDLE